MLVSRCAKQSACAAFRRCNRGVIQCQLARHDFVAAARHCAMKIRSVSAMSKPRSISPSVFAACSGSVAPQPQMNLNFSRRGQYGGNYVFIAFVNRRDALLDVRFSQPRHAQLAMKQAHARGAARQSRRNLCFKTCRFNSRGGPGSSTIVRSPLLRSTVPAPCRADCPVPPRLPAPSPGAR